MHTQCNIITSYLNLILITSRRHMHTASSLPTLTTPSQSRNPLRRTLPPPPAPNTSTTTTTIRHLIPPQRAPRRARRTPKPCLRRLLQRQPQRTRRASARTGARRRRNSLRALIRQARRRPQRLARLRINSVRWGQRSQRCGRKRRDGRLDEALCDDGARWRD